MADVLYDGVTKRFGDVYALNDLTLEIPDKEFLVLVGPSGCGKSTALRLLAGLEDISEGDVYIGGERVNDVAPKDRDIAMVFQSYALYPHMSVYDNMAFGLSLRKTPKDEIDRRVRESAQILGIEDLLDRKPRQLSGGQRQRVALGRAIVREPAVFLLDEPLSNLDAKLRVQTRAEISKLHQRLETTFVYVTHDQVEAMTMATRIAVMNEGMLQQVGTPQELYESPVNVFVAGFIGSPAMNLFEVAVTGSVEEMLLDGATFQEVGFPALVAAYAGLLVALMSLRRGPLAKLFSGDQRDDLAFLSTVQGLHEEAERHHLAADGSTYWMEAERLGSIALKDLESNASAAAQRVLTGLLEYAKPIARASRGVIHYNLARIEMARGNDTEARASLDAAKKYLGRRAARQRVSVDPLLPDDWLK